MRGVGDFILIKKIKEEVPQAGGIVIENEELRFQNGEVIATGELAEGKIKVGEVVKYDNNVKGSTVYEGNNQDYMLVRLRDIAMVL